MEVGRVAKPGLAAGATAHAAREQCRTATFVNHIVFEFLSNRLQQPLLLHTWMWCKCDRQSLHPSLRRNHYDERASVIGSGVLTAPASNSRNDNPGTGVQLLRPLQG